MSKRRIGNNITEASEGDNKKSLVYVLDTELMQEMTIQHTMRSRIFEKIITKDYYVAVSCSHVQLMTKQSMWVSPFIGKYRSELRLVLRYSCFISSRKINNTSRRYVSLISFFIIFACILIEGWSSCFWKTWLMYSS